MVRRTEVFSRVPPVYKPDVLEQAARDAIAEFGYTTPPVDWASGFSYDRDVIKSMEEEEAR